MIVVNIWNNWVFVQSSTVWLQSVNTCNLDYKTSGPNSGRTVKRKCICFNRQTIKLLPAFVSDVIAFSDQLIAHFESPYIQVSLRSCHMLFTIDWSFSRERLSHQPLERTGDYALDPTYHSTQAGEEPPPKNPAYDAASSPAHLELPFTTSVVNAAFPSVLKITQN